MVSGVLEVRIPAWMSARDERDAVADMLARVEKKQASGRRTDAQLEEHARRLNAAYLDGRATIGSIRWVSSKIRGGVAVLPPPRIFGSVTGCNTCRIMCWIQ